MWKLFLSTVAVVLVIVLTIILLAGCASSYSRTLTNASGQYVRCWAEGSGAFGSSKATSMFNDCIETYTAKGYK